ncbi:MAG TPA: hypothetical protein VF534_02105 [Paraburkholderia sp.]
MLKRMFASAIVALLSTAAIATTYVPVPLINPTGSTSGQAIVSTGSSSAPAWGSVSAAALTGILPVANGGTNVSSASGTALDNISGFSGTGFLTRTGAGAYAFQSATNGITLGNLAQTPANTVLANATGSTANVTAFSMPSCSSSASALNYTLGSGWSCNTAVLASNVSGTVAVLNGGTGATTAANARTNLGAAASGVNTDITSLNAPALGAATATTQGASSNSTLVATTAMVQAAFAAPPCTGCTTPNGGSFTTLKGSSLAKVFATNTSAQSIPAGTSTAVTGWTTGFDANSNFNASTGVFTAPATAYYVVSGQLLWGVMSGAGASNVLKAVVFANGSATNLAGIAGASNTTQQYNAVQVSGIVSLTSGQTIVLDAVQATGSSVALSNTAGGNWISIYQLP